MAVKHYWLYVLLLEQGKYYVGKTSQKDPYSRIEQHKKGFYSAQWVKRYRPIETVEIIDIDEVTAEEADRLELQTTLQYMKKFGYQNVRGGILNYSGKYVKVGDRFFREENFRMLLRVIFMTMVIIMLGIRAV